MRMTPEREAQLEQNPLAQQARAATHDDKHIARATRDAAILSLRGSGFPLWVIAKHLGTTTTTVWQVCREAELQRRAARQAQHQAHFQASLDAPDDDTIARTQRDIAIVSMHEAGLMIPQIAVRLGLPWETVQAVCVQADARQADEADAPPMPADQQDAPDYGAHLRAHTEYRHARREREAAIVALRNEGLAMLTIAEQFGITASAVYSICRRAGVQPCRGTHPSPAQEQRKSRQQAIRAMREAGHTLQAIGEALGVTRERVRQILCQLPDVASRHPNPITPEEALAILAYAREHTLRETAAQFERSVQTVAALFKRNGVEYPRKTARRPQAARRAAEMLALQQAGLTQHEIARQFGTSQGAVSRLLLRNGDRQPSERKRPPPPEIDEDEAAS